MKPLWRYTCGPCTQQGLEILCESINKTTDVIGIDNFDWMICHNDLTQDELEIIKQGIGSKPIELYQQTWDDCPIYESKGSTKTQDGTLIKDGNIAKGTLWKVCPARMRIDAHEIVMDNDIILLKKFPQIDYFLKSNMALILEEPIRFYGRYNNIIPKDVPHMNSGFMGLPPGYDFGAEILRIWEELGAYHDISHSDEQGLLMYTLSRLPSIRIKKEQMCEILAKDYRKEVTGKEEGLHFTQANRYEVHAAWTKYKKLMNL